MTKQGEVETRSRWAWLAAVLPSLFVFIVCLLLLVLAGVERAMGGVQEAGFGVHVVNLNAFVAIALSSVLLFLMARGRRVPSATLVAAGLMPWLAGLAMANYAQNQVMRALADADAASRASLLAQGTAEAMIVESYGPLLSAALFAAAGVGAGLAALAQRAPERRSAGALFGMLALVPLAAGVMIALTQGRAAWLAVLPALGAFVGLALAGAGVGRGDTSARAASLSASVPVFFALSLVAMGTSLSQHAMQVTFAAIASVGPGDKIALAAAGASEAGSVVRFATFGAVGSLLLGLSLVGYAAMRVPPSRGRIAGGVALSLLALGVFGFAWMPAPVSPQLRSWLVRASAPPPTPLVSVEGAAATPDAPDFYLAADGLHGSEFESLGAADSESMAVPLARLVDARFPTGAQRGDSDSDCGAVPYDAVRVALGSQVSGPMLAAFARAAGAAGMNSVVLLGAPRRGGDELEGQAVLRARYPILASVLSVPYTEVAVALSSDSVKRCFLAQSRRLDSDHDGVFLDAVGPGGGRAPYGSDTTYVGDSSREPCELAWLHVRPDANATATFEAANRWNRGPLRAVLAADAAPQLEPRPDDVDHGVVEVTGVVSGAGPRTSHSIALVMLDLTTSFQACFQHELVRDPTFALRVMLSLTILPDGTTGPVEVSQDGTHVDPVVSLRAHPAFVPCLQAAVAPARFVPDPSAGVTHVRYPLIFNAR